jgi:pyruvate,water dikinase
MEEPMPYLIGFGENQALDPAIVGRKFSALAAAYRRGVKVPEAFAISTRAHGFFLATGSWLDGLKEKVTDSARRLGLDRGVSVRSSATLEDLANSSFAGQYRSFLEVDCVDDLLARIEECWRSAASEAVASYLKAICVEGGHGETPPLAVIVQRMVKSKIAGVAFSRHPLRAETDGVLIEAVRGHAEGLVSGRLSPCRAVVDGRLQVEVERGQRSNASLARETPWRQIASLLSKLESFYNGAALDMEWAVDPRGTLWLLQVRPITTLDQHETFPPQGPWTRRIADDLWADRLTPFLAEVMRTNAPRFDLSRISRLAGITPLEPTLTVINGYLYVNGDAIQRLIRLIPSPLRFKHLQSLLPAAVALADIPPPGRRELLRIGLRLCLLPLHEPAMIPFLCLRMAPRAIRGLRSAMGAGRIDPNAPAAALLESLKRNLETLALMQENNQWPYFHATFFTWLLRWIATEKLKQPGASFLDLIGRGGNNVTLTIESWFRAMARRISADPKLAARFTTDSPRQLAESVPDEICAELAAFLTQFGCRSRHRTLLVARWAEAPKEVLAILQSLVRSPQFDSPDQNHPAAAVPGPSTGIFFRPLLKLLAGLTRRFLDLREELRFNLDAVLFRIRLDLLALGRSLGVGEEIFFLSPREIERLVSAALLTPEAERLAARRRQQYLRAFEPSMFWVDGRPEFEVPEGGTLLRGIGTSPGRITGRAVIVSDPAAAGIRKGDIVVARHTDPGWTPIFSLIGGIVMEEGGLLNHCSIVARELGIPAVVGVSRATRTIPEGSQVTMEGSAGWIRIEEGEGRANPGLRRRSC